MRPSALRCKRCCPAQAGPHTHTHTHTHLWMQSEWRSAIPDWPSQGQQDEAEFLHHIGPRLIPEHLVDTGHMLPLPLSASLTFFASSGLLALQSLVQQWHRQGNNDQERVLAAADGFPAMLLLQVARFNDRGHKLAGCIYPPFTLQFPALDCSVQWANYTARSFIYHLGETSTSGHYRAALVLNSCIQFLTDDNRVAATSAAQDAQTAIDNSYIFILTRDDPTR